ncbi:uncharacterized protein LOC142567970 [Dermacentor variabilis]|uniref:uncharacterized protein LOC142567970 n=1 Tax=Dermacentor variabilis TaxID=34621 RepID=UPI003F5CA0B9
MQHLGYGSERPLTNEARFERSKKRSQKKKEKDAVEASVATQQSPAGIEFPESGASSENEAECRMELPVSTVDSEPRRRDIGVQTDLTGHNIQALKADNKRLTCELCTLKKQKELLEVTEESLRQDDAKVAFYSGMINYSVLHAIFQLVESAVKHTPQNGLPKFQEFIIFLMKLKFNFPHQDLAYRFHISCATVSRIFEKWLDAAFSRLRSQIVWPSRNDIQRTMPQAFFESFGSKVAVIIDCFKIRIERPSSLQPRSETWSNYKNSNTAKFLIGICPQGVITYISEGWGGRASDKHITEHCGILEYLSQGDVVLADRGFDIADTLGLYCAKLHIPAFTRGQKQLTALDVENTRKLANVRIHVERVIGLVRNKYLIMKALIMASKAGHAFTPLDKIVTVCCALINLCPSVVPANPKLPS